MFQPLHLNIKYLLSVAIIIGAAKLGIVSELFVILLCEIKLHLSKLQINLHLLSVCAIFASRKHKKQIRYVGQKEGVLVYCAAECACGCSLSGRNHFLFQGEPREAIVALSMLESGNWILPVNVWY